MVKKGLRRGDIIAIDAIGPTSRSATPVSGILGLVERAATGTASILVWSPFSAWTGKSQFEVPQDGLTVKPVGHIRLLDAWTVSVRTEREQRLTIPLLMGLDRRSRLRVAFLGWYYETGPGRGEDVDSDIVMFLAELW